MSAYASALKKQIELLQSEIEIYANALDRLVAQLAEREAQSLAIAPPAEINTSETIRASEPEQEVRGTV
ncbi:MULTISPECIES: hypothetical protein [unclassified Rhizobium]|uniref:hypothetical protein n=1 Tax=unclassified Rhizobium TaxID=2613769 RepID=UPI0013C429EA|nr:MULTISPECIES: hypothetical protein [unclassified Rhizobium]